MLNLNINFRVVLLFTLTLSTTYDAPNTRLYLHHLHDKSPLRLLSSDSEANKSDNASTLVRQFSTVGGYLMRQALSTGSAYKLKQMLETKQRLTALNNSEEYMHEDIQSAHNRMTFALLKIENVGKDIDFKMDRLDNQLNI